MLSISSSDSSSSVDSGDTLELIANLPKNKDPLSKKETTPHTLTSNKSPPSKEDLTKSTSKQIQQKKNHLYQ
jgi:hypothetical protein